MCGIAGLSQLPDAPTDRLRRLGRVMAGALHHRGPNGSGVWQEAENGLALCHSRLSILDLSNAGAQPMASASSRYRIVFNGEIYNHLELRAKIACEPGFVGWRGHSDTETLLAAIEVWGLTQALKNAEGMFAIAVWDRRLRRLSLARDRLGEKPLYYGQVGDGLAFASELKALRTLPSAPVVLDPEAIKAFAHFGYVPEPFSIYSGVRKVPPGTIVSFTGANAAPESKPFWEFAEVARAGVTSKHSEHEFALAMKTIEHKIKEVVQSQMLSDVPVGSFLSGGIDSTLVTALMREGSEHKVRSFSIGFDAAEYDETTHAAVVAGYLGTAHTGFRVTERDGLEIVPELAKIYDEPFADSSQIPTLVLCRLAREGISVALTGDGGDEVFGGYNRYLFAPKAWARVSRLPTSIRRHLPMLARILHRLGGTDNSVLRWATERAGLPASTLHKIATLGERLGDAESLAELYLGLTQAGPGNGLLHRELRGSRKPSLPLHDHMSCLTDAEWMMAMDSLGYLPGDILVKVDRAAMSSSLETRAPLIDRRVVEAAWRLPRQLRVSGHIGKIALRHLIDAYVPRSVMERPKQGFAIPLDQWLRGALREWGEALLAPDQLARSEIFDPQRVRNLWLSHQSGHRNAGSALWSILMFLAWQEHALAPRGRVEAA